MTKHYENIEAAKQALIAKNFRLLSTGRWVNAHAVATIHPTASGQVIVAMEGA